MKPAFYRSQAIFSAISMALAAGVAMQTIIANGQANYKSRGHGQGKYSGKKRGNGTGKNYPLYSTSECERRMRQMAKQGPTV